MPIEKIASMLDDPGTSEELVQQLQELLNKQDKYRVPSTCAGNLQQIMPTMAKILIFTSTM